MDILVQNIDRGRLLLSRAGSRMLKMIADGFAFEKVTPEEAQRRIGICEGCPLLTDKRQCRECGCEVDFKVTLKTNPVLSAFSKDIELNKCPKGKW